MPLLARLGPSPCHYDIAVIGGGATGLGVALDGAARGLRVVLIEAHDFAKGTSSLSTKLVQGERAVFGARQYCPGARSPA